MGFLRHWNIQEYLDDFNLSYFIETGTGRGASIEHALTFDFKHLYTIEYTDRIFNDVSIKFKDMEGLTMLHDTSENGLKTILPDIAKDDNIFFWLDAHFPDAEGCEDYPEWGPKQDKAFRIPLEVELELIKKMRPNNKDVMLIDDLRIYEDCPFQNGCWYQR